MSHPQDLLGAYDGGRMIPLVTVEVVRAGTRNVFYYLLTDGQPAPESAVRRRAQVSRRVEVGKRPGGGRHVVDVVAKSSSTPAFRER